MIVNWRFLLSRIAGSIIIVLTADPWIDCQRKMEAKLDEDEAEQMAKVATCIQKRGAWNGIDCQIPIETLTSGGWGRYGGVFTWDSAVAHCQSRGMRLPTARELQEARKRGQHSLGRGADWPGLLLVFYP